MLSFVFHFHKKNGKRNTVLFSFFNFMKELKKELLKNIKINFTFIFASMVYRLFKKKFVAMPLRLSAVLYNGQSNTKNLLIKKHLMYFNIYVTGCYFHVCFILSPPPPPSQKKVVLFPEIGRVKNFLSLTCLHS